MPRIALVTAIAAHGTDDDIPPLAEALARLGVACETLAWDDPTVSWARFDAAVLRSPWDYTLRLPEFLAWCERVAAQTRLLNPLHVVRWNTDKHYLAELAGAGVAIVESVFLEPGDDPAGFPDWDEYVVKPTVSAGSRDTRRYVRAERAAAVEHARALLAAGRSVLAQPYLHEVDQHGETALLYFDGAFSHAIRKAALLARGEAPTSHLFAPERIAARVPDAAERAAADRIVALLPRLLGLGAPLPYARVDLLPTADGPRLLELELTEPSLFFAHAPGAADRFARALRSRLEAS